MTADGDSGLSILRTTIEAAMDIPLAITVTSARPGDGKTEVATGLALAFANAGYKTMIVDANPVSPSAGTALGVGRLRVPASLDDPGSLLAVKVTALLDAASIADDALMASTTTAALRAFADELRSRYAVTIWDSGDAFSTSLALQCAASSEGTLLAVRFGRNPVPEDARLVAAIEQVGGRIVGVVPTEFPAERGRKSDIRRTAVRVDGAEVAAAGVRRAGKSTA